MFNTLDALLGTGIGNEQAAVAKAGVVNSDVDAYIDNSKVDAAGDVTVEATANALIEALDLSEVSSSGGSAFGTGTSLAVNATIATNVVLSSAVATITDSKIGATSSIGGDVNVTAVNTSGIDATVKSSTATGDTAVGITLAFNTIGWQAQNVLFSTLDALLGDGLLGTQQPAEVIASIEDSTVDATGNLLVSADNNVQLNATVSNAAESAASALFGATGMSVSGILASNRVSTDTQAFIQDSDATGITRVDVGGAVTIAAEDAAGIFSNGKLVSSSITTNDGGASVAQETVNDFLNTDHSTDSTAVTLQFGDRVGLADDYANGGNAGSVYEYLGPDGINPASSLEETTDLSAINYSILDYWKEVAETQLIPQGFNITGSDSIAVGGLVVTNDVRSKVEAYLDDVTLTADEVTVTAQEDAIIRALTDSAVSSSGGSAYGTGTSVAVNGTIATNTILSDARAYIKDSEITTTGSGSDGDLVLDARNTSWINAEVLSATTTGDTGVGITMAFNTIGWKPQNLLFNAVDALIGSPEVADVFGNEIPAVVEACIENSVVDVAGSLTLSADTEQKLPLSLTGVSPTQLNSLATADQDDDATPANEAAIDAFNDAAVRTTIMGQFDSESLPLSDDFSVTVLEEDNKWLLRDADFNAYMVDAALNVSNEATSVASALVNASGTSLGAILASNMISSEARASIDNASVAPSFRYLSTVGSTQPVDVGDRVKLISGDIYVYDPNPSASAMLDLSEGTQLYSTNADWALLIPISAGDGISLFANDKAIMVHPANALVGIEM